MTNNFLRNAFQACADDQGIEEELHFIDGFDNSVRGMTEDGRLVYDFESMVKEFKKDEHCSEEEALDWLSYNTLRAIPYEGDRAPIIMSMNVKTILNIYGAK